jgi:hypothetical protein
MNNSSLPALSFLAVLAAILFLPISAAASSIALTITGILAMLAFDYGRDVRPLQARADVVRVDFSGRHDAERNKAA